MYCKNCSAQMTDEAAICVNCGAPKGQGTAYCANCGNALGEGAAVCLSCGAPATASAAVPAGYQQKSKLTAGLLGLFLGGFGVHNFYIGSIGKAVAQLLITLLTCGFGAPISGTWALIESIMILAGSIKVDGKGVPFKD